MSISNLYPTIAPSLNLSFALTKKLDPRITFTRTTTATYYDGKTTAKAEENLLLQSQTFNSAWAVSQTSVTADTEVAPDGTTTAETITDNAVSAPHIVQQGISLQANTEYVFSCFLKEGTNTHAYLSIRDTGTAQRYFAADFDLNGGTVRTSGAGTSGTLTSSSITSVGNGWYRCVIIGQVAAVASMFATVGVSDGSSSFSTFGSISYVGTSTTVYLWGAQLEQRSAVTAYTPTTTQPITNYVPALQTAASGVARFDHNPLTGESLGLLVEEQRTNLFLRSEEFDQAAWVKTSSSVTADTIVSPSGALTGEKLVEDTSTGNHFVAQANSVTSGTAYTFSFYAKKGERPNVALLFATAGFGSNTVDVFDLNAGTVATNASGTAAITPVGNGWYRLSATRTATATASSSFQIRLHDGTTASYTGDGYSGIYIWGAQLEAGAFPTSYIPTVAASVTRNADVATMTGTNFSSWYRADELTVYSEFRRDTTANAASGGGVSVPRIYAIGTATGGFLQLRLFGSANSEVTGPSLYMASSWAAAQYNKHAVAYKVNDAAVVRDGGAAVTDTTVDPFTTTNDRISFGQNTSNTGNIGQGWIRKLAFYPSRLSDAQLQALTTV